jgi:predicted nucleic acid-binding protein
MSSSAYAERPGRLVVDANILTGAVLGGPVGSTRILMERLIEVGIALLAPEELTVELDRHLPTLILTRASRQLAASQVVEAMEAANSVWRAAIASLRLVPVGDYRDFEPAARRRVPADPEDWPYVALALRMDCGILTKNLAHFAGSGIPLWSLETAALLLEA